MQPFTRQDRWSIDSAMPDGKKGPGKIAAEMLARRRVLFRPGKNKRPLQTRKGIPFEIAQIPPFEHFPRCCRSSRKAPAGAQDSSPRRKPWANKAMIVSSPGGAKEILRYIIRRNALTPLGERETCGRLRLPLISDLGLV